jgi:hypothetical protein
MPAAAVHFECGTNGSLQRFFRVVVVMQVEFDFPVVAADQII